MSYSKARNAFGDNQGRIDPSQDPVLFNINRGLAELTKAIEDDMDEIKRALTNVENSLFQVQQKL